MPDQAQGLRALVDRARRDPARETAPSLSTSSPAAAVSVLPTPTGDTLFSDFSEVVVADTQRLAPARRSGARVVAVTSGKGGVGKTNFACNLALNLAESGARVIVVDADLGLANVHVVLGVTPRFSLEQVMQGECSLTDALCYAQRGVGVVGGGSGIADLANLDGAGLQQMVARLSELDSLADVILFDTGAGLSRSVMSFLCAVDEVILVTTPEPTAITDAYATVKVLMQENPGVRLRLVINMAQSEREARAVSERLTAIARRFLNLELEFLGWVPHDGCVGRAVRAQQPFSLQQPGSPASQAVSQIAARLGYGTTAVNPTGGMNGLLSRMQALFHKRSPSA